MRNKFAGSHSSRKIYCLFKHRFAFRLSCLFIQLLAAVPLFAQGGGSGRIQGTVVDPDGRAIRRAFVTATAVRQVGAPGGAVVRRTDATAVDGAFSINGLPNGNYSLCVQVPGGEFLDPCRWGQPVAASVGSTQAAPLRIAMQRGRTLEFQVEDPQRFLDAPQGRAPGNHLLLGVWDSKGIFHAAHPTARASGGRTHAVTVPVDTSLRPVASSRAFRIGDAAGLEINRSSPGAELRLPPTGRLEPIRLRVLGARP